MTTRDQDFLEKWRADRPHFARWGQLVLQRLTEIVAKNVAPDQAANFIRIAPEPRVKAESSLLQKAFYRPEKQYKSPYEQIEDKVGVRLVLLLDGDVSMMGAAISADTEIWSAVVARDHETEREDKPYEFVYQSKHFVVRSNAGLTHDDGSPLPEDLPCEVQVRTLLQHAHSEVTHDTLYKSSIRATGSMKRAAAKSMALIEATGDYFSQLATLIAEQVEPLVALEKKLSTHYKEMVGHEAKARHSPLDHMVLDRYGHGVDLVALEAFLRGKPYIGSRVAEHSKISAAFDIPAILLVYFKVATQMHAAEIGSPLLDRDLTLIYSDLGLSMTG